MVQMFMRDLKKVSTLWSFRFRVSALERFCYKGFLKNSSGTKFLSVLERCPLQRMSALGRFHCKTKDAQKKKLIETQCESNINTVAEEFVSSQKILVSQTARMLGSQIHSDDIIIVDDGWPSTFLNKLSKILKFYQRYISCMTDDSRQAYNKQKKKGDQYQLARFSPGKKNTVVQKKKNRLIKKKHRFITCCCYPTISHRSMDHVVIESSTSYKSQTQMLIIYLQ